MRDLLKRPIAFHPVLARLFGGINEAILWQQIYYWSDKCNDPDGWVYKSKDELESETTLTREQQDSARRRLERGGWLKTQLKKVEGAPTLHYFVDVGLVENTLMEKRETRESIEKRETHLSSIQRVPESTPAADAANLIEVPESSFAEKATRVAKPEKRTADKEAVYRLFTTKKDPWTVHSSQKAAALRLFDYGIEKVRRGLEIMRDNEDDPYCPQAATPLEYEKKLPNLKRFMKRNGL